VVERIDDLAEIADDLASSTSVSQARLNGYAVALI